MYRNKNLIDPETLDILFKRAHSSSCWIKSATELVIIELKKLDVKSLFIPRVLSSYSQFFDQIIIKIWPDLSNCTLIATGGYGREELYPYSDIDILILRPNDISVDTTLLESFLQTLWDGGLQIGHSIRTIEESLLDAKEDLHFFTSLIESRAIAGDINLFNSLQSALITKPLWPYPKFLEEKLIERKAMISRYDENLEPNVKHCHGGLREGHLLSWFARYHYKTVHFKYFIEKKLLTNKEKRLLQQQLYFLSTIRFAMHLIAGKKQDILRFNDQKQLAIQFGFEDTDCHLAVEKFMKAFNIATQTISSIALILTNQLSEHVELDAGVELIKSLNDRFILRNNRLDFKSPSTIQKNPSALIECFVLYGKHLEIHSLHTNAIRLIKQNISIINQNFIQNKHSQLRFLSLFEQGINIPKALKKMHALQVLEAYIPDFKHITCQMQFDLFHVHTVDTHTLKLLNNIYEIQVGAASKTLPIATNVIQNLPNLLPLYIAALFHDIGKGRQCDHSIWGSEAVERFCQIHDFDKEDTELISWLVKYHLMMSITARKTDITDPEVIERFAQKVSNTRKLSYLYLLTICDIQATNIKLWNSWQDTLLKNLFLATQQTLESKNILGKDIPSQIINAITCKPETIKLLAAWPDDYFNYFTKEDCQHHCNTFYKKPNETIQVLVRLHPTLNECELLIFTQRKRYLFLNTTTALVNMGVSIVEARFFTSTDDRVLHRYILMDHLNQPITNHAVISDIEKRLGYKLQHISKHVSTPKRIDSKRTESFDIETKVSVSNHTLPGYTTIDLSTEDKPGLLATVGPIFTEFNLRIHSAKISTLGEKIEDVFQVTDQRNQALQISLCKKIQEKLKSILE